jgi:hypothetical protein
MYPEDVKAIVGRSRCRWEDNIKMVIKNTVMSI